MAILDETKQQTDTDFWLWLSFAIRGSIKRYRAFETLCTGQFTDLIELCWKPLLIQGIEYQSWQDLQHKESANFDRAKSWLMKSPAHFILSHHDLAYPQPLKQIVNFPVILYGIGNLGVLSDYQIAVVGSRHHSPGAAQFTHKIVSELVTSGWLITSGLALGIDALAHQACLASKGQTIAVMATGCDVIYPKRHVPLAQDIVANGGVLLTEFPPGTAPKKQHFPRRNRIISGLSKGVVVVEAATKSGSLITARYALEQNREVFAVPGSVYNLTSAGCHHLIKQGAKLTEQVSDINEEFPNIRQAVQQPETNPTQKNAKQRLATDKLLASVGFEATPIDVVAQRSGLPVTAVMSELLEYELRGLVTAVSGGYIRLGE